MKAPKRSRKKVKSKALQQQAQTARQKILSRCGGEDPDSIASARAAASHVFSLIVQGKSGKAWGRVDLDPEITACLEASSEAKGWTIQDAFSNAAEITFDVRPGDIASKPGAGKASALLSLEKTAETHEDGPGRGRQKPRPAGIIKRLLCAELEEEVGHFSFGERLALAQKFERWATELKTSVMQMGLLGLNRWLKPDLN